MSRTSNVIAMGKCTEKLQVMIPPAILEDLQALRRQRGGIPLADLVRDILVETARGRIARWGAQDISLNEALLALAVFSGKGADVEGFKRQVINEYVRGELHEMNDGSASEGDPCLENDGLVSFPIGQEDGV